MTIRKVFFGVLSLLACMLITANFSIADTGKKKVVIIRYRLPPDDYSDVVKHFKKEMTSKGYEEGKNIEYVDFLTSTGDQTSTPEVEACVEQHKDSADGFVTCGWVGAVVRNKLKNTKIPQVFTFVFQPVGEIMAGGKLDKPSGSNVTGVYLMYPPDKIIRLVKMILPAAKKYGVVGDSRVPADRFFKKWYEETTTEQRQGVEFIYFDLADGVEKVASAIKQSGVETFGGGVAIRRPEFATLFKLGIPVIGPKLDLMEPEKIKATDDLVGHYNPFDMCGIQAARIMSDVLGGKKKIEEIVPQPVEKQIVYVNLDAAKRLGIKIPLDLLKSANIVIK